MLYLYILLSEIVIRNIKILLFILCHVFPLACFSQDSLNFSGQASAWLLYNVNSDIPFYLGGRYIPQLNYSIPLKNNQKIDLEASLNINGNTGFNLSDSVKAYGQLKPYRFWIRYSSRQLEIRAGLQKINFGSASLLRPLMWFDEVDPRDPLRLTDGVWGILGRYYFLNNANIWLWGLYGNKEPRGWEFSGTSTHSPEAGGRIQLPVQKGEVALTYHYRIADTRDLDENIPRYDRIPENRMGFDIKMDLGPGIWLEGSWVNKKKDLGILTNQENLNAGMDYTFGIGNGLYLIFEQLISVSGYRPFGFEKTSFFSLVSASYTVGLFDNISGIVYYDWKNRNAYTFVNWQRQFNNITIYFMGFWNPVNYNIPAQRTDQNLFAGKGIQIMLVLNH